MVAPTGNRKTFIWMWRWCWEAFDRIIGRQYSVCGRTMKVPACVHTHTWKVHIEIPTWVRDKEAMVKKLLEIVVFGFALSCNLPGISYLMVKYPTYFPTFVVPLGGLIHSPFGLPPSWTRTMTPLIFFFFSGG